MRVRIVAAVASQRLNPRRRRRRRGRRNRRRRRRRWNANAVAAVRAASVSVHEDHDQDGVLPGQVLTFGRDLRERALVAGLATG